MTNAYRTLIALLVVVGLLLISASMAVAHRGRVFGPSFGAPGSGAGQLSFLTSQTGFGAIRSNLAVNDTTHDVYVADPGNRRIDEFEANGTFVRAWGWGVRDGAGEFQVCTTQTTCRAGLSGTEPGEFVTPAFVAVDNSTGSSSGDVYVGDVEGGVVTKFTGAGQLIESWGVKGQVSGVVTGTGTGTLTNGSNVIESVTATPGAFEVVQRISGAGIPAGTVVRSIKGETIEISKPATASGPVSLTGEKIFRIEQGAGTGRISLVEGVTVNLSGELLVKAWGFIYKFDSEGTYEGGFHGPYGENSPQGIAVNGSDELYVVENGAKVQKTNAGGNTIGELTPPEVQPITGIAVNSMTDELYVDSEEGRKIEILPASCAPPMGQFSPFCVPSVTFTNPALVAGAGLAIDTSVGSPNSEAVYIAETATDKIESIIPEPPAAPLVEAGSQAVSDVSGDSATLEAVVNPRSEASEEPTSYHFVYTTDERYQREGFNGADSTVIPGGQLAASFEADLVSVRVQGLEPGMVYHYRVVAENAVSRREGKPSEGERDESGEEVVQTFTTQGLGVFALPDDRAWELVSPADKRGALIKSIEEREVTQASAAGDAFTYLATAPTETAPAGNSNRTQVLSTRGGGGALSWGTHDIATSREVANGLQIGTPQEFRFFSSDLSRAVVNPYGAFSPSLSSEASEQTAFLRTDFSSDDPTDPCLSLCYRPLATGVSGFANVPEGTKFGSPQANIVEPCQGANICGPTFAGATPDASHIVLSSVVALTEGAPNSFSLYEWVAGQLQLVSILPDGEPAAPNVPVLGNELIQRNAISTDGSRIVWSYAGSLYLRDTAREETVQLGGTGAEFQAASSDDTRVFFTLAGDLYAFDVPANEALSAGHATNLTPAGGVLGIMPGASQDGSSVYFVSEKAMTGEANQHGETALAGQPNLYVEKGGVIKLVAVLASGDQRDWLVSKHGTGEGDRSLGRLTSRVSPNGRWLAFMSERPLTGYDNRDVSSGERDEEVFLYDAAVGRGQGAVVCASCNPTGARPHGIQELSGVISKTLVDGQEDWGDRWFSGNIPGWISPTYQSRYLSDTGRLFFNSADALIHSDTNGTEDVYEYEPAGIGGCTNTSASYSARSGGCIDLISSGVAREESAFLDASENGDDAFFLTSAQLSKQDTDSVPDVYDARVDGGFPEPQAPPACEGDACQSPVAAPNDPTPGSLTYRGPGNPEPLLSASKPKKKTLKCAKGKKLSHGKCVKRKSKKAKKVRKAAKVRRAGYKRRVAS